MLGQKYPNMLNWEIKNQLFGRVELVRQSLSSDPTRRQLLLALELGHVRV